MSHRPNCWTKGNLTFYFLTDFYVYYGCFTIYVVELLCSGFGWICWASRSRCRLANGESRGISTEIRGKMFFIASPRSYLPRFSLQILLNQLHRTFNFSQTIVCVVVRYLLYSVMPASTTASNQRCWAWTRVKTSIKTWIHLIIELRSFISKGR